MKVSRCIRIVSQPEPELRVQSRLWFWFCCRPHLSTVLRDELVLLDRLLDEDSPSGHVGRRQQQVLRPEPPVRVRLQPQKVLQNRASPSWRRAGWSSSCRTRSCCPSGRRRRRSGTGPGRIPAPPGNRGTAWCCTGLCTGNPGSGSDLRRRDTGSKPGPAERGPAERGVCLHSELHWQNFSQKFCAVTQGQDESQGCRGWSHGW